VLTPLTEAATVLVLTVDAGCEDDVHALLTDVGGLRRSVGLRKFNREEFAYTPIGTVQPNGQHVQWELINIFRYTDDGRLVEEWVQTDTYDLLRQLGAVET
jgi:hypothetical protein